MTPRSLLLPIALAAIALSLPACTSREKRAEEAAAAAQQAFANGQPVAARKLIREALAERDDVGDYWLLLARIDFAGENLDGAFTAYQNVLSSDRANVEALTRLCQIALATGRPQQAAPYAEQLALLSADNALVDTVRAGIAFSRDRKDDAKRLLDGVLKASPDDLFALVLQARMRAADGDFTGAAEAMEHSIRVGGDPVSRLRMLLDYYARAGDRAGYANAILRIARARPDDADAQFAYADLLYQQGRRDDALRILQAIMARRPDDVELAASIVNLWLRDGPAAMSPAAIRSGAAKASLEMKAAYAQYAIETGRGDIAEEILAGAATTAPGPAGADARATLAYVRARRGAAGARATLESMLAGDPSQPRARLGRGRLRAAEGNIGGAIEDLRQVVADDGGNVAARLDLADLLVRRGDGILAEGLLREGLTESPGDPRIPARLARLLIANDRADDAKAMLRDVTRDNPAGLHAGRPRSTD